MKYLPATQMAITFTISTDREAEIVTILQIIFSLILLLKWPFQICLNVITWLVDLYQSLCFVARVYQIAFASVRFGLGL